MCDAHDSSSSGAWLVSRASRGRPLLEPASKPAEASLCRYRKSCNESIGCSEHDARDDRPCLRFQLRRRQFLVRACSASSPELTTVIKLASDDGCRSNVTSQGRPWIAGPELRSTSGPLK